jgi:Spy/CpxP family protein refolding chaperone
MQARIRSFTPQLPRAVRMGLATLSLAVLAGFAQHAMAQPMGPHGGMHEGMGGPGGAMVMNHMLDAAGASADQRAQIKTIMQTAMSDLKTLHQSGRALHEQGQALLAAPSIDARALEALRQQELAQHDAVTKRMQQAMIDAANVLTPAQRQTLASNMAARRSLMEKQRAERAALDKSTGK